MTQLDQMAGEGKKSITPGDCQKLVRGWRDWNHDTVMCEWLEFERCYLVKVEQICEPFRTSAIVQARTKRAALAGLYALLWAGPHGRRP